MVTSIRSHRVAYQGILLRRLLHALDPGADRIGRLAVLLYDNTHREMRPVGSAVRSFREVSAAGTYLT
ncbi:MAG TPA: hypothetical protein VIP49_03815 [Candidatus Udaeobacter sp.]